MDEDIACAVVDEDSPLAVHYEIFTYDLCLDCGIVVSGT